MIIAIELCLSLSKLVLPSAQIQRSQPHASIGYCAAVGTDGGRCDHAATEMPRSRVVEPDAGGPRRGARGAARALPATSAGEAIIKATRRP